MANDTPNWDASVFLRVLHAVALCAAPQLLSSELLRNRSGEMERMRLVPLCIEDVSFVFRTKEVGKEAVKIPDLVNSFTFPKSGKLPLARTGDRR